MSEVKQRSFELMEELCERSGIGSVSQLLNSAVGDNTVEWLEHRTLHSGHPSVNCSFCVQDADMPEMEVLEEDDINV